MTVPPKIVIGLFVFVLMLGFFEKHPINFQKIETSKNNIETKEIEEEEKTTANINIKISGLKGKNGVIRISLFDNSSGFPSNPYSAYEVAESVEINQSVVDYTFFDIPFGEYAISVIQDENKNEKLDTGMFGIPTEKYGFSKNPKINFGPPSFNECKFKLENEDVQININLN